MDKQMIVIALVAIGLILLIMGVAIYTIASNKEQKIEKLDIYDDLTKHNNLHTYLNVDNNKYMVSPVQREIIKKLNKIIKEVNEINGVKL